MGVTTRKDYIESEIKAWCSLKSITLTKIALNQGFVPSTVSNFVKSIGHNQKLKKYFIKNMGYDVWEKYPEQEYITPEVEA